MQGTRPLVCYGGNSTLIVGFSTIHPHQYDLQSYFFDDSGKPHVQNYKILRSKCELISLCAWIDFSEQNFSISQTDPNPSVRVAVTFKDPSDSRRGSIYKLMVCGSPNSNGPRESKIFPLEFVPVGMYLIDSDDLNHKKFLVICGIDTNIIVFSLTGLGAIERLKQHKFPEFQKFDSPIFCIDSQMIEKSLYIAAGSSSGLLRISHRVDDSINQIEYYFNECVTILKSFMDHQRNNYFLCVSDAVYAIQLKGQSIMKTNIRQFPQGKANDLLICGTATVLEERTFISIGSYDGWVMIYELADAGVRICLQFQEDEAIYHVELREHASGDIDLCVVSASQIRFYHVDVTLKELSGDIGGADFLQEESI